MEGISITRLIGSLIYAASFIACALRYQQYRRSRMGSGLFAGVAVAQFLLLIDIAFNLRWKVHNFFMDRAMAEGVYERRHPPQLLAMLLMAAVAGGCIVWLAPRFRNRLGAGLMLAGTCLSVAVSLSEAISYHDVDRVLEHSLGPVKVVSLLYAVFSLAVWAGVRLDWREHGL